MLRGSSSSHCRGPQGEDQDPQMTTPTECPVKLHLSLDAQVFQTYPSRLSPGQAFRCLQSPTVPAEVTQHGAEDTFHER